MDAGDVIIDLTSEAEDSSTQGISSAGPSPGISSGSSSNPDAPPAVQDDDNEVNYEINITSNHVRTLNRQIIRPHFLARRTDHYP